MVIAMMLFLTLRILNTIILEKGSWFRRELAPFCFLANNLV